MNFQKSVSIVAAMLITAAGMTGIASYSNSAIAHADRGADASAVITLPTVHVHPSAEQIRELRESKQAGATPASLRMPYYSFASDSAGT